MRESVCVCVCLSLKVSRAFVRSASTTLILNLYTYTERGKKCVRARVCVRESERERERVCVCVCVFLSRYQESVFVLRAKKLKKILKKYFVFKKRQPDGLSFKVSRVCVRSASTTLTLNLYMYTERHTHSLSLTHSLSHTYPCPPSHTIKRHGTVLRAPPQPYICIRICIRMYTYLIVCMYIPSL